MAANLSRVLRAYSNARVGSHVSTPRQQSTTRHCPRFILPHFTGRKNNRHSQTLPAFLEKSVRERRSGNRGKKACLPACLLIVGEHYKLPPTHCVVIHFVLVDVVPPHHLPNRPPLDVCTAASLTFACAQHFAGSTGYGHADAGGRDALDAAFAEIAGAEAACVRAQARDEIVQATQKAFVPLCPE